MAVSLCLTGMLCLGSAACSDPGDGPGGTGGGNTQTMRIFTYAGQEFDGVTMDAVMKQIEDKVGVKLSFEGDVEENYYTKLSPMMSSGDWPDIIWADPENSGGAFQTWADPEQEVLYNLDDYLPQNVKRYPYLNKLVYSDQYKNIKYYDGHYIVPEVQTTTAWAIYYRADWLKQIGFVDDDGNAKAPETLDEFEYVMSEFTGTGKFGTGRTYGISPNTENFYVNPLYGAFGITPDWDITDSGEVSYMYAREEFKPYLEWMNAMYKKGYIEQTFNQNTGFTDRDSWYNGRVGCIMTNGEAHMEWVIGNLLNTDSTAEIIVGPPPVGTGNTSALTGCKLGVEGERGFSNWGGYYGGYAVTAGTKDVYKALDLLEYLVSPEGSMLRLYGIEGRHYTLNADGSVNVDLDGRNAERVQYFGEVTYPDGTKAPGGLHEIGSRFGYNIDWDRFEETGEITVATDIGSVYPKFGDLERHAVEYTKYLQTSKLTNVTAYPAAINIKMMQVMRIASNFINNAITGNANLAGDWDKMISDLNGAGYGEIREIIKETAIDLGIIGG